MPIRMRMLAVTTIGLLASTGVTRSMAAPELPQASTMTVAAPPPGTAALVAQNGLGPLQGPLASPGPAGTGCCPCRHVTHRVVHRSVRVARPRVPVAVAAVPLVPLVPYRPVYVYRPLLPVLAYRPFLYRPYFYRPFFYGPRFYY